MAGDKAGSGLDDRVAAYQDWMSANEDSDVGNRYR